MLGNCDLVCFVHLIIVLKIMKIVTLKRSYELLETSK